MWSKTKPFEALCAGEKGGGSRSPAKVRAARLNGKKGGRKRTRTLAEFLLRRRIPPEQYATIDEAFHSLTLTYPERDKLKNYFAVDRTANSINLREFSAPDKKPTKDVQHVIKKFRLEAEYRMRKSGRRRLPLLRPYVVLRENRSPREQAEWERQHPDIPCPPQAKRVYYRTLPCYRYYDFLFSKNPSLNLTAKAICQEQGAQMLEKIAEALLADLRQKHQNA